MLAETNSAPAELAKGISRMYELMRIPVTSRLSNAAAAEVISKLVGTSPSPAYLMQLRTATKSNPTKQCIWTIAQFFAVPASYLLDSRSDKAIDSQSRLLAAMKDADVRNLVSRASGLTPETLESQSAIVGRARELENLSAVHPKEQPRRHGDSELSLDES